jgi:hypothetical protein
MNLVTKSGSERENIQVEKLRSLIKKYEPLFFTEDIIVEQGAKPHSHPVLTLNTRPQTDEGILGQLIHEQLHWYAVSHERYKECIDFLRDTYNKPDGDVGSTINGFWEHIIVCYNTRVQLEKFFGKEKVNEMYDGPTPYTNIDTLISNNWEKVTAELSSFNMIAGSN